VPVKGTAIAAVGVGCVLVYSGVRGYSLLKAAQNVIQGQSPNSNQVVTPFSTGNAPVNTSGQFTSQGGIAGLAEQYNGHKYVWDGTPGANGQGGWDCSSFVNYVVGARAGMAIPGFPAGAYAGQSHGPNTIAWMSWSGCTTVSAANALPGDIVVGPTHMGIYTGAGHYFSAHDPKDGTGDGLMSQFPDALVLYRRLKA
jgi:cell wall-associated NlpC family hydrolase